MSRIPKPILLIFCVAVSFAAGAIGSLTTIPNIESWYAYLVKPPLLPPNWVFGPVWSMLYFLMGVALYLVAVARTKVSKSLPYGLFAFQLTLNTLWSLVFFGWHQILLGLVIILMLLGVVILTAIAFWPIDKRASYALVPYIVWISFATYLNTGVALLN